MATLNYDNTVSLFNDLKKSIDEFYLLNQHLENCNVFSMSKILRNCTKMEYFLNSNFEYLWKMEHDEVRELREKLENIPVEIIKNKDDLSDDSDDDDDYDDMPPLIQMCNNDIPPLIPIYNNDISDIIYDDIPPLIPASNPTTDDDEVSVHSVCSIDKAVFIPSRPESPVNDEYKIPNTFRANSPPTVLKTSLWGWPLMYNSNSALLFNEGVRNF